MNGDSARIINDSRVTRTCFIDVHCASCDALPSVIRSTAIIANPPARTGYVK